MGSRIHRLRVPMLSGAPFPIAAICSACEPHRFGKEIDGEKSNLEDEVVEKLRKLLHSGRSHSATSFLRYLILSKSPFSPSSDIVHYLALAPPSLKPILFSMLLRVCSESKMAAEGAQFFVLMKKDGTLPSIDSVNVLLESLVSTKQFDKTLNLFVEIVESEIGVHRFMYGKAIQAAVNLGDLKRANQLLGFMYKRGLEPTVFIYNLLIGRLCREKMTEDAHKLFDEMLKRKLVPNRVTYNTLIAGYCKVGKLEEAFNVKEWMRVKNVEPNLVTFNSLFNGLCKENMTEEVKKVLEEMEDRGLILYLWIGIGTLEMLNLCFLCLKKQKGMGLRLALNIYVTFG